MIAGLLAWGLFHWLPFTEEANKGLALLVFIGTLWLTEAVHVTITAILVVVVGVVIGIPDFDTQKALSSFANPVIYLFFGGFALASALHIQQLDKKSR